MNKTYLAGAAALLSSVAACSEQPNTGGEAAAPAERAASAPADVAHVADGRVTAVTGETVTISHGPIPSLQWPAMTMAFRAPGADMLEGVAPGDQVSFAFRESDGGYVLTSLSKN